jgi:FO synthase
MCRAAGAAHGQELRPEEMQAVIMAAGRRPWQRNTVYGAAPAGQIAKSFEARELLPLHRT